MLDPDDKPGTTNDEIRLEVKATGQMEINGVQGMFEDSGNDYRAVPYQGASRYAKTGDVLEFTVNNCGSSPDCTSGFQHHPFHMHGFSFQPYKIIDNESGATLYEYNYNEFQDVIVVFDGQSVVFRTRLDDRPIITDDRQEADAPLPDQYFPGGGAQGRWVHHCHLFLHAALGMISELVVVPTPVAVCQDLTVDTAPGFCSAGPLSIDDGSFHPDGEFFTLLQDPSSGVFQLGQTTASLTATGTDGLSTTCEATITVVDNENPTITAPADVVDECDDPCGSTMVDLGSPTTDDNCGQNYTMHFGTPSCYPLGNTDVKWQTSDGNGNSAIASQVVTVVDSKKPSLMVPDDVGPVECTGYTGEEVYLGQATATDVCDADVAISNDAPALYQVGTTTVHWTAKDDSGNSASGNQDVIIADNMAPAISCNADEKITPSQVVQSFTATARDTCDAGVIPEAFEYDCYSFTKKGTRVDRTQCDLAFRGEIVDIIDAGGVGNMIEWRLLAVDDSGNSTTKTCTVEVVRKKDL